MKRTRLRRNVALGRPAGPRPVSGKRRQAHRRRARLGAEWRGGVCRLRTPVCTGRAQHLHELVGRGQGGSIVDRRNLIPACDPCNGWVEDNPAVALANHWKLPGWSLYAAPGDGGLVPRHPSRLVLAADDERGAA